MSVPCPRCGREYDVTLFELGRTIDCTCGARVGLEPRVRPFPPRGELRFAADAMLGRLARWLRLLGLDTFYDAEVSDEDLVRRAIEESRVLLTRDRALPEEWRVPWLMVLRPDDPLVQLRQVADRFGLDWRAELFTRCAECNAPLRAVAKEAARGRVPQRVYEEQERFRRCTGCGRIYWEGSHTARMRRTLERALAP